MNYQLSVYSFFSILCTNQLFKSTGFPDEPNNFHKIQFGNTYLIIGFIELTTKLERYKKLELKAFVDI